MNSKGNPPSTDVSSLDSSPFSRRAAGSTEGSRSGGQGSPGPRTRSPRLHLACTMVCYYTSLCVPVVQIRHILSGPSSPP